MRSPIDKLTIEGFKSIRALTDFKLRDLNVLIGANGSGKSNFVSFFSFLREMVSERLQVHVQTMGGADSFLHMGPAVTQALSAELCFGLDGYQVQLLPTASNQFVFNAESLCLYDKYAPPSRCDLGSGHTEALARKVRLSGPHRDVAKHVFPAVASWVVYHFQDTGPTAPVKRPGSIRDNEFLRPDAGNLAAFLWRLQQAAPAQYATIEETVRLAAPFFKSFLLRPTPGTQDQIQLEWTQVGSDYPFHAWHLSDGTLRFICLATALLQPNPPSTIIIDEPELGLHPYALTLLAGLIKQAATKTQVIVSTQSVQLLDHFSPEDVIVVDRSGNESLFRRLEAQPLRQWLEDYTLGELWQKNVIGGGPA